MQEEQIAGRNITFGALGSKPNQVIDTGKVS